MACADGAGHAALSISGIKLQFAMKRYSLVLEFKARLHDQPEFGRCAERRLSCEKHGPLHWPHNPTDACYPPPAAAVNSLS